MPGTPRKLYQRVAESLAQKIASGEFVIGSRLPTERDLADMFEVSRPTIREAMIALELRGLVEARHGSGIYVIEGAASAAHTPELDVGAFELIEARVVFESEAAALAATAIDHQMLNQLRELVDKMEREPEQCGKVAIDREFHILIAATTGNSLIRSTIEMLWDVRERSPLCVDMFARAARGGIEPRENEHRAIVDALARHDSHAAREAMRIHLRRVTEDLLEATRLDLYERATADIVAQSERLKLRYSA